MSYLVPRDKKDHRRRNTTKISNCQRRRNGLSSSASTATSPSTCVTIVRRVSFSFVDHFFFCVCVFFFVFFVSMITLIFHYITVKHLEKIGLISFNQHGLCRVIWSYQPVVKQNTCCLFSCHESKRPGRTTTHQARVRRLQIFLHLLLRRSFNF